MRAQLNLWLEQDGKVVLSYWRVRLLKAIENSGSITAAAEEMGVAYRRAWEKLQEMEEGLGHSEYLRRKLAIETSEMQGLCS